MYFDVWRSAHVRFLTTEEGGRRTNPITGLVSQLRLGEVQTSCIIESDAPTEDFVLGKTYPVRVRLMLPGHAAAFLSVPSMLEIFEGERLVGKGKFLNEDVSTPPHDRHFGAARLAQVQIPKGATQERLTESAQRIRVRIGEHMEECRVEVCDVTQITPEIDSVRVRVFLVRPGREFDFLSSSLRACSLFDELGIFAIGEFTDAEQTGLTSRLMPC